MNLARAEKEVSTTPPKPQRDISKGILQSSRLGYRNFKGHMDTPKPPRGSRANVAALIAVAVLVGALLWVAQAIVAHNSLQNCIDSGRRTCIDIEQPGQSR